MNNFNIKLTLYKSRTYADKKHPVMIRVSKNNKKKYISTGFTALPKEWDKRASRFRKNYPNHVKRNLLIYKMLEKGLQIADELNQSDRPSSLDIFRERYHKGNVSQNISLFDYFKERISDLEANGKIGNSKTYNDSLNAFRRFAPGKPEFSDVSPKLLAKFETFLRRNDWTDGGISVVMRTMRATFNHAIRYGVCKPEFYPFNIYEIKKLKAKPKRRALTREDVRKIEMFNTTLYPELTNARNYFVFSYYTRGMNFADMIRLRWDESINNGKIVYYREKTGGKFTIGILKPVKEILNYYFTLGNPAGYIFPVLLKEEMTEKQIFWRKKRKLKEYNSRLREIAALVGVKNDLTSYVARHSFATNLKQAGAQTNIIKDLLGHSDTRTTETYLKSFSDQELDQVSELLLK